MSKHEDRARMTLDEARGIAGKSNTIDHIVDNGDQTFSVVSHINCEWCDFCEESQQNSGDPNRRDDVHLGPFPFKADIYENVGR